ncbi:nucleotide pyrophosphohydrolase [Streptomyces griseoluteus]|uniref:nucleotide pyrophosphohydrolase n=1 Tax=Streptomyces griseoluteus TaxID=29306 RepID=UPI0036BE0F8E
MTLEECRQRTERVRDLYDRLHLCERGRVWTNEEFALGFVGDVGDLAKLVTAEEGARARDTQGGRAALEHELADCLCSVLVLADRYDINLRTAFHRTMTELETAINARLALHTHDARPDEAGDEGHGP